MDIKSICKSIKTAFQSVVRQPAKAIPAILLLCSFAKRPGLSCIISTANIIQSLSSKGIPTEDLPDGSPNFTNKFVNTIVGEIFRAIKEDMNIQIALGPGALNVTTTGSNAGGQMTSFGANINVASGGGIAQ